MDIFVAAMLGRLELLKATLVSVACVEQGAARVYPPPPRKTRWS